jgi:hypothetical protein
MCLLKQMRGSWIHYRSILLVDILQRRRENPALALRGRSLTTREFGPPERLSEE